MINSTEDPLVLIEVDKKLREQLTNNQLTQKQYDEAHKRLIDDKMNKSPIELLDLIIRSRP